MAVETERQARRGRRITGYVFKRGKAGFYYLRFAINNTEHCIRLLNPQTQQPVTSEREAKRLAAAIVAPYAAQDLLALRQSAAEAVRTAEDKAAAADQIAAAAQVRKTPLADMLDRHPAVNTAPRRQGAQVKVLTAGTRRQHGEAWRGFCAYMASQWPDVRFGEDVTPAHAAGFAEHVLSTERHCRATLNNKLAKLSTLYRRAGLPDPFAAVPRYAVNDEHESKEPLTVDELRKVLSTATGELRTLLHILTFTGLRVSDASTLTWQSHIRLSESRIIRRTRKTGKVVSLRLHPELLNILSETPEAERTGHVMPRMARLYAGCVSNVSRLVSEHFARCGLQTTRPPSEAAAPRLRAASIRSAHALRHTFVTLCARAGVPQGAIADWIGHSREIDAAYTHWQQQDSDNGILAALPSLNGNGATKALPAAVDPERAEAAELLKTASMDLVRVALAALKGGAKRS